MNKAVDDIPFLRGVFGFTVLPAMALERAGNHPGQGRSGQYSALLRQTESGISRMRRSPERIWL